MKNLNMPPTGPYQRPTLVLFITSNVSLPLAMLMFAQNGARDQS